MAHVVTERCVDCRYTDCCAVCPVECFWEITSPAMLVIDPDTCIDCALCVPECPIAAIWPLDELPDQYAEWTDKNAALFSGGTKIKAKKDALSGALGLGALQAREKQRGWTIQEPSAAKAAGEGGHTAGTSPPAVELPDVPVPAGLSEMEANVYRATSAGIYKWRTVRGVAMLLKLPNNTVQEEIEKLVAKGHLKKQAPKTTGATVYGSASRN